VLKKSGLGEPFGKASLANTVFGLGRFITMRERRSWTGEGWYRYPSEAWPDEAMERGLPRPLAKRGKKWGRTSSESTLIFISFFDNSPNIQYVLFCSFYQNGGGGSRGAHNTYIERVE